MKKTLFVSLALGLLLSPVVSSAAIISGTFNFSASFPSGTPVNPVSGSFSITFDNSVSQTDSTSGFTLNSLNLPIANPPGVGYSYSQPLDTLTVGGLLSGVGAAFPANTDFIMLLRNFSTTPTFLFLVYTDGISASGYRSTAGSIVSAPVSVPEPGTLALLGLGLASLGFARRKRAA